MEVYYNALLELSLKQAFISENSRSSFHPFPEFTKELNKVLNLYIYLYNTEVFQAVLKSLVNWALEMLMRAIGAQERTHCAAQMWRSARSPRRIYNAPKGKFSCTDLSNSILILNKNLIYAGPWQLFSAFPITFLKSHELWIALSP